jgi:serine/threonine-protein kinase
MEERQATSGDFKAIGPYMTTARVYDTPWEDVFHAVNRQNGDKVTLKLVAKNLPAEVQKKLFENESRTLKMLEHPSIPKVIDAGFADGRYFIAVELLNGPTVKNLVLEKKPMPMAQKLGIIAHAADALEAAHLRKIIHQSLLPRDIVVLDGGRVKVHGFHLRRMEGEERSAAQVLFGKMVYLAPEQVKSEGTTPSSDIFSLGTILYEFLAFAMPFPGREVTSVLIKIVQRDPEPLRNFLPDAPDAVLKVIDRALAKKPSDRYPTMAAFAEELRATAKTLGR